MVLRKLFTIDSNTNGRGPVLAAWQPDGTYLACVGANRRVTIADRQGKTLYQIALQGQNPPIALDWNQSGDTLAILQAGSATVTLWSANNPKDTKGEVLDTGMEDCTFLKWSMVGEHLAVGNSKGQLMIYDPETRKKNQTMGTHTKKINTGCWSRQGNMLCLAAEDRKVSFCDTEGNVKDTLTLRAESQDVKFSDCYLGEVSSKSTLKVAMIVAGKSLILHQPAMNDNPIELAFNPKYGNLVSFDWVNDSVLLIGTSAGHCLLVDTQEDNVGCEISALKSHRDGLSCVTFSKALRKGASCGDNSVRVFDMDTMNLSEQNSEKYDLDNEFGALTSLAWTDDGQILTATTKNGNVVGFLTRVPVLSDMAATAPEQKPLAPIPMNDLSAQSIRLPFMLDTLIAMNPFYKQEGDDYATATMVLAALQYFISQTMWKDDMTGAYLTFEKLVDGNYVAALDGGHELPLPKTVYMKISSPFNVDQLQLMASQVNRLMKSGELALGLWVKAKEEGKKQDPPLDLEATCFTLELGLHLTTQKCIQLMHFTTPRTQMMSDFASTETIGRWFTLLAQNGVSQADMAKLNTIMDLVPVRGPSLAGSTSFAFLGDKFDPFALDQLDMLLQPSNPEWKQTIPIICFGGQDRAFLWRNFKDQLFAQLTPAEKAYSEAHPDKTPFSPPRVFTLTNVVKNRPNQVTPIVIANHPSMYLCDVYMPVDGPDDKDYPRPDTCMQADLITSGWISVMQANPQADPEATLDAMKERWANMDEVHNIQRYHNQCYTPNEMMNVSLVDVSDLNIILKRLPTKPKKADDVKKSL